MTHRTRTAAYLGLAVLTLLGLSTARPALAASDIITFDNFSNEPARNSLTSLSVANGGSATFDGVTFSSNSFVIGDQFGIGMPHSGNYAFTPGNNTTTKLTTSKTLYGLYLGTINPAGNPASSVTISALGTGNIILASLTDPLTSTTESFFDTSSFASLTGITGYTLVGSNSTNPNNHDFSGDDFTFSAPTPPVVSGTFDFESNTVGQQTTFTDTSGGIKAIFSTSADTARVGGFTVENSSNNSPVISGNYLSDFPSDVGNNLHLSVAFDHSLGTGSIAFFSDGAGALTVQELFKGQVVGTATSAPTTGNAPGTLAFGGVSFDSLLLSDTNAHFAIDNLKVTSAPEPSQAAALAFTGLGLGGLLLRARKRKTRLAE